MRTAFDESSAKSRHEQLEWHVREVCVVLFQLCMRSGGCIRVLSTDAVQPEKFAGLTDPRGEKRRSGEAAPRLESRILWTVAIINTSHARPKINRQTEIKLPVMCGSRLWHNIFYASNTVESFPSTTARGDTGKIKSIKKALPLRPITLRRSPYCGSPVHHNHPRTNNRQQTHRPTILSAFLTRTFCFANPCRVFFRPQRRHNYNTTKTSLKKGRSFLVSDRIEPKRTNKTGRKTTTGKTKVWVCTCNCTTKTTPLQTNKKYFFTPSHEKKTRNKTAGVYLCHSIEEHTRRFPFHDFLRTDLLRMTLEPIHRPRHWYNVLLTHLT